MQDTSFRDHDGCVNTGKFSGAKGVDKAQACQAAEHQLLCWVHRELADLVIMRSFGRRCVCGAMDHIHASPRRRLHRYPSLLQLSEISPLPLYQHNTTTALNLLSIDNVFLLQSLALSAPRNAQNKMDTAAASILTFGSSYCLFIRGERQVYTYLYIHYTYITPTIPRKPRLKAQR